MNRIYAIAITIAIEAVSLWFISYILDWALIDTLFLGGLAIFGLVWLYSFYTHQLRNESNANAKVWSKQDTGSIKPFKFKMSAISVGLLLFTLGSFVVTIFAYYPYFIN